MGEQREHTYPVGTIRHWESGDVIKCHDNSVFASGWIPLTDVPEHLDKLFLQLDELGRRIVDIKEPIDGELWLKRMLSSWEAPSGEIYNIDEFKQFFGFFGSAKYAFRNVFSTRLMREKIDLKEFQNETLLEINEERRKQGAEPVNNLGKIFLTKEEIKSIKKEAKENFKWENNPLDLNDPKALKEELEKILVGLRQANNLEGEDKEIYDKNIHIINTLEDEYIPLKELNKKIYDCLDNINARFKDNFAIIESFRDKVGKARYRYINKYSERIKDDELISFQQEIGCDIFDKDINKFYSALNKFINKTNREPINLDDYVGKFVPSPWSGTDFFLEKIEDGDYVFKDGVRERRLERVGFDFELLERIKKKLALQQSGIDINIPFQLRFNKLYNKDLQGSWDVENISSLKGIESVFNYLPYKHAIGNNMFTSIGKEGASNDSGSGYACYLPSEFKIFLSEEYLNSTSRFIDIHDKGRFASVMIHEIGHSVSNYLGRKSSLAYRIFGKQCGWNWSDIRHNYHATGDDKDIKRTGENRNIPLITPYAHKSPEEAFAENYSFYMIHRGSIDRFLDFNDDRGLRKNTKVESSPSKKNVGETYSINFASLINVEDDLKVKLNANHIDITSDKHAEFQIVEPFKIKVSEETKNNKESLSEAIYQERQSKKAGVLARPIMVVKKSNGDLELVDKQDEIKIQARHYLKQPQVVLSISNELLSVSKSINASSDILVEHILSENYYKNMPEPIKKDNGELELKTGLIFDDQFISTDIIKKNKNVFKAMRNLVNSDEFKKALDNSISVSGEPTMKKSTLIDLFKSHIIDPIKEISRKHYADCFIFNNEKQLLLLRRCCEDQVEADKYCLPGGKVESSEGLIDGAYRELLEETGLRTNLTYLDEISNDDNSISHYYIGYISPYQDIELSSEHDGYVWVDKDNYKDFDLIFDLKDRIEALFYDDIDYYKLFIELFPSKSSIEIQKAFEQNIISEKFVNYLKKSNYYSWSNVGNEGRIAFSKDEDDVPHDLTKSYYLYNNNYYDDKANALFLKDKVNLPVVLDYQVLSKVYPAIKRKELLYNQELNSRKKYHEQFNSDDNFQAIINDQLSCINNESTIFDLYKSLSIVRRNISPNLEPTIYFQFGVDKVLRSLQDMIDKLSDYIKAGLEDVKLGIDLIYFSNPEKVSENFNKKDFLFDREMHNSIVEFVNKKYKQDIDNELDKGWISDDDYLNLIKYA